MSAEIFYLFLLIVELILVLAVTTYMVSLLYSSISGAPYVPSSKQDIEETLKQANLRKGQFFLELGSGDGRVVILAVKKYQVRGIGIEISPFLVFYSRVLAKFKKIGYIEFKRKNIFKADLSKADVIYMFLMPKMLTKLSTAIKNQTKKRVLIISHGFKIPNLDKYLIKTISRKIFSSYLYKIC